ncbi:MAG: hypothetical protein ACKVWR_04305 [Acidimicrobiales bacterium]
MESRLRFLVGRKREFDLVFVHRDAENQSPQLRRDEIERGRHAAGLEGPVVPVVPVRMTEAWLLLDEQAIRRVAGKPSGRVPLDLPAARDVERIADPKQILRAALLAASGAAGRRREQFVRDFGRHRALLLERLDPTGPVSTLAAWRQLCADVAGALAAVSRAAT